ncbi:MAG: hypothetical protein U1F16_18905 [Turneriella sp.]
MAASKNRLQVLYNHFEREFASAEQTFLAADKHRLGAGAALQEILAMLGVAREKLGRYPKAGVLKRITLIETLIKDLDLRYQTERRHFNALGFLISRLRNNLAMEMLEPKLYGKIRSALEQEETLKALREKYPDAPHSATPLGTDSNSKPKKPEKTIRLMLISAAKLHYAIPVTKIVKKTPAGGALSEKLRESGYSIMQLPATTASEPMTVSGTASASGRAAHSYTHAIAYIDMKDQRRIVYCDDYFQPVEIGQRLLRKMVQYLPSGTTSSIQYRPLVRFYGKQFFVYGARLSYTVRTGVRDSAER